MGAHEVHVGSGHSAHNDECKPAAISRVSGGDDGSEGGENGLRLLEAWRRGQEVFAGREDSIICNEELKYTFSERKYDKG